MTHQTSPSPSLDLRPPLDAERPRYVRNVLRAYRHNPATVGHLHANDRRLAERLFERGVPYTVVEGALALAVLRRASRPDDAEPLRLVRSLAYFLPVIDELMAKPDLDIAYLEYLNDRLHQLTGTGRGSP